MVLFNWKTFLLAFLILGLLPATVFAQDDENKWYERIAVSGGITSVLQSTIGNDDETTGTTDTTNYSYTMDIILNVELEPGHRVYVFLETGEGEGIADSLPGGTITPNWDANNTHVNNTGHQDVVASQVFYEGLFLNEKLTVDIGKMEIHVLYDQNNFANNKTIQFLSGILNMLPAGTLFATLEDYYAPGIKLLYSPIDMFEVSYVFANSKKEEIERDIFQVWQVNIKPNLLGKEGNYRIYYLMDDTLHDDGTGTLVPFTNIKGERDTNTGFGVSIDQFLTDDIGVFFRYGAQDDEINANAVKSALSGGFHFEGALWNREDDFVGIGYGSVAGNDKSSNAIRDSNGEVFSDQWVTEIYYHWQIAERIAISPDLQLLNNLQREDKRNVTVFGVRAQIDF